MNTIEYELEGGVATVTLNRPEARNAITAEMAHELGALFVSMRLDSAVRAVVIAGANASFCSGGDVRQMGQAGPRSHEERRAAAAHYRPIAVNILALDKPVIAAVDGAAFGAGFSLALLADIVLASDRARFSMVFHRIGLVPDLAAWYTLPRIVGLQRAKELIYSAREVSAAEAKTLGIVMEVLPATELPLRAQLLAQSLANGSALAVSLSKQALQVSLQSDLNSILDLEASGLALSGGSDYAREAMRRMAAKEPAQFSWPAAAEAATPERSARC
jgi:2-(1,2-epoxy-1,2-dihydrophenyl)acetyl-CoA isomerase